MSETETRVAGASDDLVELDGAIYDEFDGYDWDHRLTFDNGVRLILRYDRDGDGIWRIEAADSDLVKVIRCEDRPGYTGPDGRIYSDEAIVTGATKVKHKIIRRTPRQDYDDA
ncbi:hypothetical protein [Micropruina sp.]|uniref:hypothetical protein n=1 Tax=Micropruina sp. TaxID=2737536 RepID=UPI0039E45145